MLLVIFSHYEDLFGVFCLFVSTAIVEKDAEPEAPDDPRPTFCVL